MLAETDEGNWVCFEIFPFLYGALSASNHKLYTVEFPAASTLFLDAATAQSVLV
jgi:hypothetical protein